MACPVETFLKKHPAEDGHTHTKIGNRNLGVYGGSYHIQQDSIPKFYELYKKHILMGDTLGFYTEKQMEEGPILIDIDFRYKVEIEERQHKKEHVVDLVQCIVDTISTIKQMNEKTIECYVMERENVRFEEDKTKDGIHIILNLKMDYTCKIMMRDLIIKNIPDSWNELPLTNTWEDVFDDAVIRGHSNWQLYGSRKPDCEPYRLKQIYVCHNGEGSWSIKEKLVTNEWILQNFENLTARNLNLVQAALCPDMQQKYDEIAKTRQKKTSKSSVKLLEHSVFRNKMSYEINNAEELEEYIESFMETITSIDYKIREAYQYVMTLPTEYWGENSYAKWIRVGWALRQTDNRLFPVWIKFSAQSPTFDYANIPSLHDQWCGFNRSNEGLTLRSILYWSKISNPTQYYEIRKQTISHFIEHSATTNSEYDLATVLYHMFKDVFICVSIHNKKWYEFIDNRWKAIDDGHSLRAKISTEMYECYKEFKLNNTAKVSLDTTSKPTSVAKTAEMLKVTAKKQNIMKEAMEIFYDKDFYAKLNTNEYLLGCNNCVIDFKAKEHRVGRHDDYISMSTGIAYKPIAEYRKSCPQVIKEIETFMEQLFPNANRRRYMWEHLASTLMGNNLNQSFNVYIGKGKNGKSKLVELMTRVLGEYKSTVPISMITQKRNGIGGTSSEVCQLVGTRYAVMQEPSKGDVINEGIMKEITGGDPIQCRALFQESMVFKPQFKLAVCTNTLFDIKSNDDGTWRRIRVVDFESKFTTNPYKDPEFPIEAYPYQYELDTQIDEKFDIWAPVLLSMLVEITYEKQGHVTECKEVSASSDKYRQSQDVTMEFISACIRVHELPQPMKLKITIIQDAFRNWYSENGGTGNQAGLIKELKETLTKKFGNYPKDGWARISLIDA